jgi:hypothetical protein
MKKSYSKTQAGLKWGYRSGLELVISEYLKQSNKSFSYETEKLSYIKPATNHTYTPDFVLPKKNGGKLYIETKGRWVKVDREKMDFVFQQHPDIDIRFVFQNPNAKLYKGSKTTYAQYCDKKGWLWSKKEIPQEWLDDCL